MPEIAVRDACKWLTRVFSLNARRSFVVQEILIVIILFIIDATLFAIVKCKHKPGYVHEKRVEWSIRLHKGMSGWSM